MLNARRHLLGFFLQTCDSKEMKPLPEIVPDECHGALLKLPLEGKGVINEHLCCNPSVPQGTPQWVCGGGAEPLCIYRRKE